MFVWLKKRSQLERRLFFCACFALAVFGVGSLFLSNAAKMREQNLMIAHINAQISETVSLNDDLRRQIEYTKTDAYVEQAARDQLGYIKPGELRFVAK